MANAISQRVLSKDVSRKHPLPFQAKPSQETTKRCKVPSLLETGLQILLFRLILSIFYNPGSRFTRQVRSLINITDANIHDAIGISIPEVSSYEEITSIRVDFSQCIIPVSDLVKLFDFIFPSIIATRFYVRFVANIGGLESSAS